MSRLALEGNFTVIDTYLAFKFVGRSLSAGIVRAGDLGTVASPSCRWLLAMRCAGIRGLPVFCLVTFATFISIY